MPGRALKHQLIQLFTDTGNKSNIGFCTTPVAVFLCSGKRQCNRIVIHDLKNRKHQKKILSSVLSINYRMINVLYTVMLLIVRDSFIEHARPSKLAFFLNKVTERL